MNRSLKYSLKLLGGSILFWTTAMVAFSIFRYFGMDEEGAFVLVEGMDSSRFFWEPFSVSFAVGVGLGIVYAIVDFLLEKYLSKRISLGLGLLIKISFRFLVTVFIITTIITLASNFLIVSIDLKPGWWIYEKRFWSALFYIVICSVVLSFIKIAMERFGRGTFFKILMGTYSNPKEEDRIFMFLDLKDSTTIAEKLGHKKYSQFIQDCFFDLNEVVLDYDADIYQYVGDEAVLSWTYNKGVKNNNCIGVFFAFQEQRSSRKKYYEEKYGVYPEFKAGLHGGPLMIAEVGTVKKELAYHGDVINTSARIQAECNKHNVTILLSEKLLNDLNFNFLNSTSIGNVLLKGKKEKVNIYTILKA